MQRKEKSESVCKKKKKCHRSQNTWKIARKLFNRASRKEGTDRKGGTLHDLHLRKRKRKKKQSSAAKSFKGKKGTKKNSHVKLDVFIGIIIGMRQLFVALLL